MLAIYPLIQQILDGRSEQEIDFIHSQLGLPSEQDWERCVLFYDDCVEKNGKLAAYFIKKKFALPLTKEIQQNSLFFCCKHGYLDVVQWLVEKKGTNVNYRHTGKDKTGYTPLMMAYVSGQKKVFDFLYQLPQVNFQSKNQEGKDILQLCFARYDLTTIKHIVEQKGVVITKKYFKKLKVHKTADHKPILSY